MASILSYKNTLGDDFKIFSSALNLFPGMLAGVSGALAPPLAFAPAAGVALIAAVERGDYAAATRIQVALMDFIQQIGALHRWFRAAQHEALRHLGFPVERFPRWPTADMPEHAGLRMREAIDTLNGQIRAAG
jgi:dihydrodipicolinate synthase/N-acetylneuraminate lyase